MTASLLRHPNVPAAGQRLRIDGVEGRHGAAALRLRPGETVLVGDGKGTVAECRVMQAGGGEVEVEVIARQQYAKPQPLVRVIQALPKSERSELAVELATEAGADEIYPWQAQRCVAKWSGGKGGRDKSEKGRAKWEAAARAAVKQSRRPFEPYVGELWDTRRLCEAVRHWTAAGDAVIVLDEQAAAPFTVRVREALNAEVPAIVLVVGPEGGVAEEESMALREAGACAALLGPEVLRTSTAAAVALGAIGALSSRWDRATIH